jgi:hypothetical protein
VKSRSHLIEILRENPELVAPIAEFFGNLSFEVPEHERASAQLQFGQRSTYVASDVADPARRPPNPV